jgi:hypothetical protein
LRGPRQKPRHYKTGAIPVKQKWNDTFYIIYHMTFTLSGQSAAVRAASAARLKQPPADAIMPREFLLQQEHAMNIGVCGLGMMGRAHLANAVRMDGVSVAALCDSDPQHLRLEGEARGNISFDTEGLTAQAARFEQFDRMLDETDLDVIVLAVPTHLHAEFALRALGAGVHVFCEKPIALTVEDAGRMCSAAREHGLVLMTGHVVRFMPAYAEVPNGPIGLARPAPGRRVQQAVRRARLGRVRLVRRPGPQRRDACRPAHPRY